MMKIYGAPRSSAGRCYWTLEEAGAEYEGVPVSFKDREHKAPAYLALNPNGKVPVFTHGDMVLWESIAINRYIAGLHAPALLGESPADQALVDQWSVWSQVQYQPPVIEVFIQLVFVPEERRSQEKIDTAKAKIGPMHATLDAHLAGREFMVGDSFSLADINVASVTNIAKHVGIDLSEYKNLSAWLERCMAREARKRVDAMG